jgi:hypothetical protein
MLWPAAALAVTALIWCCSRPVIVTVLRRCAAHALLLLIIAAICTAIAAARRKPVAQRALARSWLAALPSQPSLPLRVARMPLAVLALIVAALLIAVLAGLPPAAAAAVLVPIVAGGAVGFVAGWLPPYSGSAAVPASWYGALPGGRTAILQSTLLPLGRWPLSRARVWGRPQITARWALLALLGIPLGTPAAKALAAVAAVLVGWHLLSLLAAVVRIAFAAAWWLRPTSIGLARFGAALVYLAWSRQLIICILGVAAAAALGSARMLHAGAALAAAWLALCCLSGAGACGWALLPRSIARSPLHRWMR